ncbi:MAG: hypothetical protein KDB65_05290 [Calditrichaeota bacterium]|nr:hypothetical protein [Calditrichota bacterium]
MQKRSILLLAFAALFLLPPVSYSAEKKGQAAFLKSLVIPGWGQYENGRPTHALAFFSADLLFLGAALSLNHNGRQLRDSYEAFAATHAGVIGSHGKDFYVDVANWMNVYDFNDQRMSERNFGALYDTYSEYWSWDSDADRARMDQMRVDSDRSYNRVVFAVALMGVNHIVSAFHAARLQTQMSGKLGENSGWNVTPQRVRGGGKVNFSLWW